MENQSLQIVEKQIDAAQELMSNGKHLQALIETMSPDMQQAVFSCLASICDNHHKDGSRQSGNQLAAIDRMMLVITAEALQVV